MKKMIHINGQPYAITIDQQDAHEVRFELNGTPYHFTLIQSSHGGFTLQSDHHNHRGYMTRANIEGQHQLMLNAMEATISAAARQRNHATGSQAPGSPVAPMPGVVQKVLVTVGDEVQAGDHLVVMEAMKMQITIEAPHAGTIAAVHAQVGNQVREGDELVRILSGGTHAEDPA